MAAAAAAIAAPAGRPDGRWCADTLVSAVPRSSLTGRNSCKAGAADRVQWAAHDLWSYVRGAYNWGGFQPARRCARGSSGAAVTAGREPVPAAVATGRFLLQHTSCGGLVTGGKRAASAARCSIYGVGNSVQPRHLAGGRSAGDAVHRACHPSLPRPRLVALLQLANRYSGAVPLARPLAAASQHPLQLQSVSAHGEQLFRPNRISAQ